MRERHLDARGGTRPRRGSEPYRAAAKMDELFGLAAARLAKLPKSGRPGKIPGTRELIPHESYRLVYEIDDDTVWILALVHTSRHWPPEN